MFIKEQLRKRDTLWIIRIINRDRGIWPRLSYGQRFWRIWGPFIIEWGIQIAVSHGGGSGSDVPVYECTYEGSGGSI